MAGHEKREHRLTRMMRTHAENPYSGLLHGEITGAIIRAFFLVYEGLGFGFLESVYANALANVLESLGMRFEREVPVYVWFDGRKVGHFRADFLVEGKVLVEIKASSTLCEADRKQVINYLRGTEIEVGLLLHFGPKAHFERIIYMNKRKARQRV